MLEEFIDMLDIHLEHPTTSRHQIEIASDRVQPVQSALYRARPAARQFCADKIDGVLQEDTIKPTATKQTCAILLTLKKDSLINLVSSIES